MEPPNDDGWASSADAWIAVQGTDGDWARRNVLDPAMLARLDGRRFARALDVGCGEGRFCRTLATRGIPTVGIDPTDALLAAARARDPAGDYRAARGEALPFADATFDLVVSYLTLIDIPDFRAAITEMTRVLTPDGTLLIANLTGLVTPLGDRGWIKAEDGTRLYYPVDRYLDEFAVWVEWSGIRVLNWHRPLGAYMTAFLGAGLRLVHFDEPDAVSGEGEIRVRHRRVPWFRVMEWRKPAAASSGARAAAGVGVGSGVGSGAG